MEVGYQSTGCALTSPPDFLNTREAEGVGTGDRVEGDSVVLERCWQPSLRTCINIFLLRFNCLCLPTHACVHTLNTLILVLRALNTKGRRTCNVVNSLYIFLVQSSSLKVALLTDPDPGCSCLCCIWKETFRLRFVLHVARAERPVTAVSLTGPQPTEITIYKPLLNCWLQCCF